MKLMRAALFCSALAVIWLVGAEAKAGPLAWRYNWSRDTDLVTPGDQDKIFSDSNASTYITLTDAPLSPNISLPPLSTNSTVVTATNLELFSTAAGIGDSFTAKQFELRININDEEMGTGSASFMLQIDGHVGANGSDDLDVKLLTPTPQNIVIGTHTYSLSMPKFGFYNPPPPPGSSNKGGISFAVKVTVGDEPNPSDSPEPGTIILSCVGLAGLGLGYVRRLKARKTA
jgi:hypothetical protein